MQRSRPADTRVKRARTLRRDMTDAERRLWQHLRHWSGAKVHFRRQATIGPYFADFACHTSRIVIELDGGQHGEAPQMARDRQRDAYFIANGYRVLRFWNHDVMKNIEGVLTVIAETIDTAAAPHP